MNVVKYFDMTKSGSIDARVAELDGKFYVYRFNQNAGQIESLTSPEFAKHTDNGIRYVGLPFNNEADAVAYARQYEHKYS